jgi:hypothetical protein
LRYRSVALPPEHGGWGLLFEPIIIGLIAAPSGSGLLLATAAVGVFLSRQPLKIFLTDTLAKRSVPRTRHAAWFAAGYLGIAGVTAALAWVLAGSRLLMPIACAVPLASVQLAYDARNKSRGLFPELCGAAALAASAGAIALADGQRVAFAMALWAVAAARTIPAMVTVRTRVLRLRGEPATTAPAFASHAIGMAVVFGLRSAQLVPQGVLTVLTILAARAAVTLRASAPRVRAQQLGVQELVVGLVAAAAIGWLCRRAG